MFCTVPSIHKRTTKRERKKKKKKESGLIGISQSGKKKVRKGKKRRNAAL